MKSAAATIKSSSTAAAAATKTKTTTDVNVAENATKVDGNDGMMIHARRDVLKKNFSSSHRLAAIDQCMCLLRSTHWQSRLRFEFFCLFLCFLSLHLQQWIEKLTRFSLFFLLSLSWVGSHIPQQRVLKISWHHVLRALKNFAATSILQQQTMQPHRYRMKQQQPYLRRHHKFHLINPIQWHDGTFFFVQFRTPKGNLIPFFALLGFYCESLSPSTPPKMSKNLPFLCSRGTGMQSSTAAAKRNTADRQSFPSIHHQHLLRFR